MINLQIDTKVYVKYNKSDDWKLRYFLQWGDNENSICCAGPVIRENCTTEQWYRYPYWRVAEGKYKGINSQEKSLTEGRSNLAVFCLILGSSNLVMSAIVKYLSPLPKGILFLDILGICSLTIFILIMIFGKK